MHFYSTCVFWNRADYWVSQNKKYCDFCRCWITDNRPSVDFHEKGRRHQENIKKRLRNITRHSNQVQKNQDKQDATITMINCAALEAYKKDMEFNADLSSATIKKELQAKSSGITKLWKEAKTRDGQSYYFNFLTKEKVWTPPKEGFLSLEDQRRQADKETEKQLKAVDRYNKQEAYATMYKVREEEAENIARKNREMMKARRVVDDTPPETSGPLLEPGKTNPYGRWQTVKETPVVDWQLPEQEAYYYEEPVVEYEPEVPVKEFKEKTVESLGGGDGEVSFKKRKLNSGAKCNSRQRTSDDD